MTIASHAGKAAFIIALSSLLGTRLATAGERDHVVPDRGRACANAWIALDVPDAAPESPIDVAMHDPWKQIVWQREVTEGRVTLYTRDWADGTYTVRFNGEHAQTLNIDSELFGRVRARCGVMLRDLENRRDADGLVPKKLAGVSNLLQRIMTLFVWSMPEDHLEGQLYFCEQQLGYRTASATVRILGSGASEFHGYGGAYLPGRRERTGMFVPPNAVVDFGANTERKLERWGYGVADIDHIFVSHNHADHFDAEAIKAFAAKRKIAGLKPVVFHAGRASCRDLRGVLTTETDRASTILHEVEPGDTFDAGDLHVEVVRATHQRESSPHGYILGLHDATIYYGTDSGYPNGETLEALSRHRFDVFAHDFTIVSADDGITHSDLGDMHLLIGKLRRAGALDGWTRVVALHQGFEGPQALPDGLHWQSTMGYQTSYDGMPLPVAWRVENPRTSSSDGP